MNTGDYIVPGLEPWHQDFEIPSDWKPRPLGELNRVQENLLDPSLLDRYVDASRPFPTFNHPHCINTYHPSIHAMINDRLCYAYTTLAQIWPCWNRIVPTLVEKPYRLAVVHAVRTDLRLAPDEYWDTVRDAWTATELTYQSNDLLEDIFDDYHLGEPAMMMNGAERAVHANLERRVRIYRGANEQNADGWSWTLDFKIAKWFSKRFGVRGGRVYAGTVDRRDVIAYLDARGEAECIVDPVNVHMDGPVSEGDS